MKKVLLTLLIAFSFCTTSNAQLEGFIGEVKMFAGNYAPRGWAFCDGQLLPISQHSAVFSVLGTTYGGDGRTTFGLPDLRGRVPMGAGQGPGLTPRAWGAKVGAETNFLHTGQLPSHNHTASITSGTVSFSIPVNTTSGENDVMSPGAGVLANTGSDNYTSSPTTGAQYGGAPIQGTINSGSSVQVGNTGNNLPVNNMQPSIAIHYIICLQGVWPSRS